MNNTQRILLDAANIRMMGTDTDAGLSRIASDIKKRAAQVEAGLISLNEAKQLIKQG